MLTQHINGSDVTCGTGTCDGAIIPAITNCRISLNERNTRTRCQLAVQIVHEHVVAPPSMELILGDVNMDGEVNGADVSALVTALADIPAYKLAHGLSDDDFLAIADVDQDGFVTNLDIFALINLINNP